MKKLSILILFFISVTGVYAREDIHLDVQVPKSVQAGERFEIVFSLRNASTENFKSPKFRGCKVLSGPSISRSSQLAVISGLFVRSVSENRSYILQAGKKGTVVIPSVSVSDLQLVFRRLLTEYFPICQLFSPFHLKRKNRLRYSS